MAVDLPVLQDMLEVVGAEELRDGLVELDVQGVLQLLHPGGLLGDLGRVLLQVLHAHQQAVGHVQQGPGHPQQVFVRRDVVDPQLLYSRPGVVGQIIHGGGEAEQVLPVDGGDEGAVDVLHQLPADGIGLLLLDLDEVALLLAGLLAVIAQGGHRVPDHRHLADQQGVEIETLFPLAHTASLLYTFRKSGRTGSTAPLPGSRRWGW